VHGDFTVRLNFARQILSRGQLFSFPWNMKRRPPWFYQQSGAIPYRLKQEEVEVLLITSRGRGRWIIPKGVIDPGMSARETACNEAYEEAGIHGQASARALGKYQYDKWGGTCTVKVFGLKVSSVLKTWPEDDVRRRQWMSVSQAVQAVKQPALKKLILRFLHGTEQPGS
jgi:phosphohistidine phosphatase